MSAILIHVGIKHPPPDSAKPVVDDGLLFSLHLSLGLSLKISLVLCHRLGRGVAPSQEEVDSVS